MQNKFKKWELALMAGLLVGVLSAPGNAAQLPLSRWQEQESYMRYQVSLFPFGFAEARSPVMAQVPQKTEYEVRFKLLEWWEGRFGQSPVFSQRSARE